MLDHVFTDAIGALRDAEVVYPMDPDFDGNPREVRVKVSVDREGRSARIDFRGTTAELATNYNAPEPVTRAAVLYVFRCLVDDDIPMNEGVMRPLEVVLPPGTMLSPRYPAAVIAGNVETSQAVTSALFLALGVQAAAQSLAVGAAQSDQAEIGHRRDSQVTLESLLQGAHTDVALPRQR